LLQSEIQDGHLHRNKRPKKKRMSLVCLYVEGFTFSTNLDDIFSSFG
jgi:hypothetical protein